MTGLLWLGPMPNLTGCAAAIALSLGTTGCFLPVRITERASPPITGDFMRSDGSPAAGMRIAVTDSYRKDACQRSRLRTTVDSAGAFVLPGMTREVHWVLIMPPVERFSTAYRFCVGTSDSTLRLAYEGYSSLDPHAPGDTLSCFQWDWQGLVRINCTKSSKNAIITGGRWATTNTEGFYRLIPTKEGPFKGPDGNHKRPRLVVQWVEPAAGDHPITVRAAVEVPSGEKYRGLEELRKPHFWQQSSGWWCLTVQSTRYKNVGNGDEMLWYELGPPGEVRQVDACGPRVPNVWKAR